MIRDFRLVLFLKKLCLLFLYLFFVLTIEKFFNGKLRSILTIYRYTGFIEFSICLCCLFLSLYDTGFTYLSVYYVLDSVVTSFALLPFLRCQVKLTWYFISCLMVWAGADSKRQGYLGFNEFVTAMQVLYYLFGFYYINQYADVFLILNIVFITTS